MSDTTCHQHIHFRTFWQVQPFLDTLYINAFEGTSVISFCAHCQHKGLCHKRTTLLNGNSHIAFRYMSQDRSEPSRYRGYHFAHSPRNSKTSEIDKRHEFSIIFFHQSNTVSLPIFRTMCLDIINTVLQNSLGMSLIFILSGNKKNQLLCCLHRILIQTVVYQSCNNSRVCV